jgi:hypothetical protein
MEVRVSVETGRPLELTRSRAGSRTNDACPVSGRESGYRAGRRGRRVGRHYRGRPRETLETDLFTRRFGI